jgi:hypothetical protein
MLKHSIPPSFQWWKPTIIFDTLRNPYLRKGSQARKVDNGGAFQLLLSLLPRKFICKKLLHIYQLTVQEKVEAYFISFFITLAFFKYQITEIIPVLSVAGQFAATFQGIFGNF